MVLPDFFSFREYSVNPAAVLMICISLGLIRPTRKFYREGLAVLFGAGGGVAGGTVLGGEVSGPKSTLGAFSTPGAPWNTWYSLNPLMLATILLGKERIFIL